MNDIQKLMLEGKERLIKLTKSWCLIGDDQIICQECATDFPFRSKSILQMDKIYFLGKCSSCEKNVTEEVVICRNCYQVFPKGYDSLIERGSPCVQCLQGL